MLKLIGRFVACGAALALTLALAGEARASFYAYSVQQTSNYTFSGATVGTLQPLSSTSAAQLGSPSGSETHQNENGGFDALQSYVGPAGTRPGENTFTALGQVHPDYVRGDALVTAPPGGAFGTNNVAEAFLIGPGNSAGSGSWAVSAAITVTTPGALTLSFNYTNQLTLSNTGVPFPGIVAADYGYTFSIQNAQGVVVFTSSPTAVNNNVSLVLPGSSVNLPGSGTVTIISGQLATGTYVATISGSEHTFINSSVPEPGAMVLLGIGGSLLAGVGLRRRNRGSE